MSATSASPSTTRRGSPAPRGEACRRGGAALWHTTIQGRSTAELGEILGLSANAAAALVIRARDRLRRVYLAQQPVRAIPDGNPEETAALSGRPTAVDVAA